MTVQLRSTLFQCCPIDAWISSQPGRFGMFFALYARQNVLLWSDLAKKDHLFLGELLAKNSTKDEGGNQEKRRRPKGKSVFDTFLTT